MGDHTEAAGRRGCTHQIEDAAGNWIWMGEEQEMSVIFRNLSGQNFAGQPTLRHEQYLACMRHMNQDAWPGRGDPYAPGATIRLATVGGQVVESHTFPLGPGVPSQPVEFPSYMPDSPSYQGRVRVLVDGARLTLTTWEGAEEGAASMALSHDFGAVVAAGPLDDVTRQRVFASLSDEEKAYIERPADIDGRRAQRVLFRDGEAGVVMLWGECCFVSVIKFRIDGTINEFANTEGAR